MSFERCENRGPDNDGNGAGMTSKHDSFNFVNFSGVTCRKMNISHHVSAGFVLLSFFHNLGNNKQTL